MVDIIRISITKYFFKEPCQINFLQHIRYLLLLYIMNRQTILLLINQKLFRKSNNISKRTYLRFFILYLFLALQILTNVYDKLFVSLKTIIILLTNTGNYILNFYLFLNGQELSLQISKSKAIQHLRISKMRYLSSISIDY